MQSYHEKIEASRTLVRELHSPTGSLCRKLRDNQVYIGNTTTKPICFYWCELEGGYVFGLNKHNTYSSKPWSFASVSECLDNNASDTELWEAVSELFQPVTEDTILLYPHCQIDVPWPSFDD